MKVVLFCGGLGLRMRVGDDPRPKPMMSIGDRPVLWHIMRYYAHFGHTEFILCLGYGAEVVKDYFLHYDETASNDFVLSDGGRSIELMSTDISDWRITFVDTGLTTEIGERLRRVRPHLGADDTFLAHYGDVLTDAPLNEFIDTFERHDAAGSLMAVPPPGSFHLVRTGDDDLHVAGFQSARDLPMRINGGFFILRQEIFDFLEEGEDLVTDACAKAARAGRMLALPYDGFWAPMDTLKERATLEDLYRSGESPWTLWRSGTESIESRVPGATVGP
ncbi:glucose-1-phosphate cytidylyltransferase [Luteipulveratus mongoliensis]|uniref:Glucose-1-phosphate cytidylyltransferase n=1 Tax=Luteipulveratus mongoliensis TaxID=571913 RepID=A0A0K1JH66_9MICO|nr:glucose-1-phosphate cytidylyltransferase [Luteipulveratus mongoliensis]AKU15930.1 glucose-1-phosphate cytidylyltransferase [Luteipulveratus mongoliensis]